MLSLQIFSSRSLASSALIEVAKHPRYAAMAVLVLLYPIHLVLRVPGGGVNLSLGDGIVLILLLFLVADLLQTRQTPPNVKLLAGFLGVGGLSLLAAHFMGTDAGIPGFSPSLEHGALEIVKLLGAIAWFLVFYTLVRKSPGEAIRFCAYLLVGSATAWALLNLSLVLAGQPGRAHLPFENPNALANYFLFSLFTSLYIYATRPYNRLAVIFTCFCFMVLLGGILVTGSRGAAAATILLIPAVFFAARGQPAETVRLSGLIVGGTTVCLILVLLVFQPFGAERLFGWVYDSSASAVPEGKLWGRLRRWEIALHVIAQSPLYGIGFGQSTAVNQHAAGLGETHNMFLSLAAETGAIGLTVFLMFIGRAAFSAPKALFHDAPRTVLAITVLALLVQGLFTNAQTFRSLWIALALATALHSAVSSPAASADNPGGRGAEGEARGQGVS